MVSKSVAALGAEFVEIDNEDLAAMRIESGVRISKLNAGKLASIGIQPGFIVTSIDKKKIVSVRSDIKNTLGTKSTRCWRLLKDFIPMA